MKPEKQTKSQRLAKALGDNKELEAQLVHKYHFSSHNLDKTVNRTASGVIITIEALGGQLLVGPVLIKDGLSKETADALRKDIKRSYDLAISLKPKE